MSSKRISSNAKENRIKSNEIKESSKRYHRTNAAGCHCLDGPLICDQRDVGLKKIQSAWNESLKPLEGNATRNKCVFCSHDPFSVNIETRSLKRVPNERPLCPLSRSRSSGSNSSRFIASRSAALSDHIYFMFVLFFRDGSTAGCGVTVTILAFHEYSATACGVTVTILAFHEYSATA